MFTARSLIALAPLTIIIAFTPAAHAGMAMGHHSSSSGVHGGGGGGHSYSHGYGHGYRGGYGYGGGGYNDPNAWGNGPAWGTGANYGNNVAAFAGSSGGGGSYAPAPQLEIKTYNWPSANPTGQGNQLASYDQVNPNGQIEMHAEPQLLNSLAPKGHRNVSAQVHAAAPAAQPPKNGSDPIADLLRATSGY